MVGVVFICCTFVAKIKCQASILLILHLEVQYITSVTQDITFLVAVAESVSHQGHGVAATHLFTS